MFKCADIRNPCRAALEKHQGKGKGRSSWDPIVILKAIRDNSSGYAVELGRTNVYISYLEAIS